MKTVLQVIRTKSNLKDANATSYMNAILTEAELQGLDITIRVANNQGEFTRFINRRMPTLVLEPCEFAGEPLINAERNQTARAVVEYIKELCPAPAKALVVNRSHLVGRPLANLLLNEDYTVSIAHSKTEDLYALSSGHDIVITATGATPDLQVVNKYIVDVSNDLSRGYCETTAKGYVGMSEIGSATVKLLLADASDLTDELEIDAQAGGNI